MSTDTIPTRANDQTIDETWYNVIQDALGTDLVPRAANGIPGDAAGSLGSSSYLWLAAYVKALKFIRANGDNAVTMQSPVGLAAAYTVTLFSALPGSNLPVLISDSGVLTAAELSHTHIAGDAVTAAKIAAGAVTTAKIEDGAVTDIKRSALNYGVSSSCGSFTSASTSFVDITNLSVTITTIGRPVFIALIPDGSGAYAGVLPDTTAAGNSAEIAVLLNGTEISRYRYFGSNPPILPAGIAFFHTGASAGSNIFKAQAKISTGAGTLATSNYKLVVFEL